MQPIRFHSECIPCLIEKALNQIPENSPEAEKLSFSKTVLHIISDAPVTVTAPEIVAKITDLTTATFATKDNYSEIKQYFNSLMLSKEEYIKSKIKASDNPLYLALCYAMLGNYIDFGAMNSVDENYLNSILNTANELEFDSHEFINLKSDLQYAKSLVYITDNCGEIVMDKLFIEQIKKVYPLLDITVIVRGAPVINDATIEDALAVGLDKTAPVIPNGTNIAGTCLDKISEKALYAIENANVIISKGQGNFETLSYSNKNIYYLFLCKCNHFANRFGVKRHAGMMLNDLRMK